MLALDKSASALVDESLRNLLVLSLDPSSLSTLPGLSSWLNPLDFTGGNTRPGYPVVGTNLCSFRHEYLALEWVDVGVAREDLYLEGVGLEVGTGVEGEGGEDRVEEVIEEDGTVEVVSGGGGGRGGGVIPPTTPILKGGGGTALKGEEVEGGGSGGGNVPSPPSFPSPTLPPHTPLPPIQLTPLASLEAGGGGTTPTARPKPTPLSPAFSVPKPSFLPKGMLPWEGGKSPSPSGWGGGSSGSGGSGSGGGSGGGGLRLTLVSPRIPRSTISVPGSGFIQTSAPTSSSPISLEVPPTNDANTTPKGGGKASHPPSSPPSPGMLMVRGFPLSLPPRERKRW